MCGPTACQRRRVASLQAGYSTVMKQMGSHSRLDDAASDGTRPLRRIVVTAGLVVVGLILILVAIYAGAFLILAPMMQ